MKKSFYGMKDKKSKDFALAVAAGVNGLLEQGVKSFDDDISSFYECFTHTTNQHYVDDNKLNHLFSEGTPRVIFKYHDEVHPDWVNLVGSTKNKKGFRNFSVKFGE